MLTFQAGDVPALKTEGYLRYIVISDIHLFHQRNSTEEILANLYRDFSVDSPYLPTVDIIFIAGDLTHTTVMYGDKDAALLQGFINHLLDICSLFKITLRILEGTPSHDRGQAKHFTIANDARVNKADVKYVDVLSIEEMEAFGITVLYVPDEWRHDNSITLQETKELLASKGLETVSLAIMHGYFGFQVPNGLSLPHHDEEEYLKIVDYYISIGHVHTRMEYDRIDGQGSYDRIAHNEEEDKGFTHFSVKLGKDRSLDKKTFVVNKGAKIFKTFDISEMSEESLGNGFLQSPIKKEMDGIPDRGMVRFKIADDPLQVSWFSTASDTFPNLNVSATKVSKKVMTEVETEVNGETWFMPRICLNKKELPVAVDRQMVSIPKEIKDRSLSVLNELMSEINE